MAELTGAEVLAKVLKEEGVDFISGIVAGHIFEIMMACDNEDIRMIHMRHEQSGVFLADAWGRVTGRPGVCFGGGGYGVANMIGGIRHAYLCRGPVIALTGSPMTVDAGTRHVNVATSEDICEHFTKWSKRITDWRTISYQVHRAFKDATTYPMGPILIELPAGILHQKGELKDQVNALPAQRTAGLGNFGGDPAMVEKAVRMLLAAQRPIVVGGEDIYWSKASDELKEFVELLQIPVHTTRLGRGAVPEDHPLAFRGGYSRPFIRRADVAASFGLCMSRSESFGRLPIYNQETKFIMVSQLMEDLEAKIPSEIRILGNPKAVLRQMIDCAKDIMKNPPDRKEYLATLLKAKEDYRAKERATKEQTQTHKPIHPDFLAQEIVDFLDDSATIIQDSLYLSHFTSSKIVARFAGQVLDAAESVEVGHSVGMALGAQLGRPGKQVLGLIGDGGFGISGMDMETAVRYGLPVVFILYNNHGWTSTETQKPYYAKNGFRLGLPIRDSFSMLPGIRYDKMFEEVGCHGEYVTEPEQIRPALERAFNSGKPSIINVMPDVTVFPTFVTNAGAGMSTL